jgi:sugar transferase (PEP-CTERM/EpsH1 system associated)
VTAKPKILFLVHRVPFPPNRGDRVRSWQLVKWLAARADLDLATLADEPVTNETRSTLQSLCRQVAIEPVGGNARWLKAAASLATGGTATEGLFASRPLQRTIDNWSRSTQYDAVVVFCSSMARYLNCRALTDVPVIVDFVDVDSQKWRDYAAKSSGLKRRLFMLEGNRLCRLEQRLCQRANTVTVVSNDEADLLRKTVPDAPVRAIENGVDLDYFAPSALALSGDARQSTENSAEIVFVGALDYRANVDGVVWFCENVWPGLQAAIPNVTLSLVGRCPTPPVLALGELPGVSIAANVPDVRPYLARAAAVVAPLRIARGIQNKVLEAAAMAKAVVASPQALTGLELEIGKHAVCANEPIEWIKALVDLLSSKEKQQQIGLAARNFVEQNYRWEARLSPLNDVLSAALNRGDSTARLTNAASARCAVAWNDG